MRVWFIQIDFTSQRDRYLKKGGFLMSEKKKKCWKKCFLMKKKKMLTLSKFASGVVIRGWYVIFYHNKNKAFDLK